MKPPSSGSGVGLTSSFTSSSMWTSAPVGVGLGVREALERRAAAAEDSTPGDAAVGEREKRPSSSRSCHRDWCTRLPDMASREGKPATGEAATAGGEVGFDLGDAKRGKKTLTLGEP